MKVQKFVNWFILRYQKYKVYFVFFGGYEMYLSIKYKVKTNVQKNNVESKVNSINQIVLPFNAAKYTPEFNRCES